MEIYMACVCVHYLYAERFANVNWRVCVCTVQYITAKLKYTFKIQQKQKSNDIVVNFMKQNNEHDVRVFRSSFPLV